MDRVIGWGAIGCACSRFSTEPGEPRTDVQTVMSDPAFRAKFMELQMFESMAATPEQFADYIRAETQSWARIVQETHLAIN